MEQALLTTSMPVVMEHFNNTKGSKGRKRSSKRNEDQDSVQLSDCAHKVSKQTKRRKLKRRRKLKEVGVNVETPTSDAAKTQLGNPEPSVSSNWMRLRNQMGSKVETKRRKQKDKRVSDSLNFKNSVGSMIDLGASGIITKILALDCEMVGVGPKGEANMLARVSIVNASGIVVFDSFVAPTQKVTDYRTKWSGVRSFNLHGAPSFQEVRSKVLSIVSNRTLIGHALQHDLEVLGIDHPSHFIRDTSTYPPLMKLHSTGRHKPRSLKELAFQFLGLDIQIGEHSSVEDARAALRLYQIHQNSWEIWISKGKPLNIRPKMPVQTKKHGKMRSEQLIILAREDYMADM